ncbi:MAG: CHAT domain-containing protein [Candidatus Thiodiazotropha sp.]
MSSLNHRFVIRVVMATVLIILILSGEWVTAGSDQAHTLQQQAIVRLDRYVDHFRRTFDRTSLLSELTQAETELATSAHLFQATGDMNNAALSWIKLGDVRRYREQWSDAVSAYESAADAARQAKSPALLCQALLGHARTLLYGTKAADTAKTLILHAIPLADKESKWAFDSYDLLAQVQIMHGDLAGAADSLGRAFASAGGVTDDKLLFYGYLDRADVYQKIAEKCDYERNFEPCLKAVTLADRDYRAAQGIAEKLGWDGLADQMRGFLKRLEIRKQMIESQRRIYAMIAKADLFSPRTAKDVVQSTPFVTGENPQAARLLTWIEAQGGLPTTDDARGAYVHGLFSEISGDTDQALQFYLAATDLLDKDRGTLKEERARAAFVEDKVEFYYTALLHLLQRSRTVEAFEMMERARSRVMLDLVKTRKISLTSPQERGLYARQLALSAKIAQYQNCLFAVRSGIEPAAHCALLEIRTKQENEEQRGVGLAGLQSGAATLNISGLQQKLDALQGEYHQLDTEIAKRAPRLLQLARSEPTSLSTLQGSLGADGSELIAYLTLDSQLLIWHVSPTTLTVHSVFLPRSELKRKVATLRATLIDPASPYDKTVAYQLYLYLLSPVLDEVRSKHLVIVPHEDLYYLPFQALYQGLDKGYLGSEYEISYAPSTSLLTSLPSPRSLQNPNLLAAADPSLRYAPDEVRSLNTRFSGLSLSDAWISETAFKISVGGRQLVHLAMHGSFIENEPLLSYLHLKADSENDGHLTAAEMYGLPLDAAQLVTLSACETGTVRATHANEILGMTRMLYYSRPGRSTMQPQPAGCKPSTPMPLITHRRMPPLQPSTPCSRIQYTSTPTTGVLFN